MQYNEHANAYYWNGFPYNSNIFVEVNNKISQCIAQK